MKRLLASLRWDVVRQYRNGFYAVTAFVVVFWVGVLRVATQNAPVDLRLLGPAIIILNLMITTFYFVAAIVLLEKAEGTLTGLVVTPLRDSEYLLSKVLSLTGLAMVETLAILLLSFGGFAVVPLLVSMLLCGSLYTLAGFIATARYDSINSFILPSGLVVAFMALPLLDLFGLVPTPLFWLHPVQPAIVIARAAFEPVDGPSLLLALALLLGWNALALMQARRLYQRYVVRQAA